MPYLITLSFFEPSRFGTQKLTDFQVEQRMYKPTMVDAAVNVDSNDAQWSNLRISFSKIVKY